MFIFLWLLYRIKSCSDLATRGRLGVHQHRRRSTMFRQVHNDRELFREISRNGRYPKISRDCLISCMCVQPVARMGDSHLRRPSITCSGACRIRPKVALLNGLYCPGFLHCSDWTLQFVEALTAHSMSIARKVLSTEQIRFMNWLKWQPRCIE